MAGTDLRDIYIINKSSEIICMGDPGSSLPATTETNTVSQSTSLTASLSSLGGSSSSQTLSGRISSKNFTEEPTTEAAAVKSRSSFRRSVSGLKVKLMQRSKSLTEEATNEVLASDLLPHQSVRRSASDSVDTLTRSVLNRDLTEEAKNEAIAVDTASRSSYRRSVSGLKDKLMQRSSSKDLTEKPASEAPALDLSPQKSFGQSVSGATDALPRDVLSSDLTEEGASALHFSSLPSLRRSVSRMKVKVKRAVVSRSGSSFCSYDDPGLGDVVRERIHEISSVSQNLVQRLDLPSIRAI